MRNAEMVRQLILLAEQLGLEVRSEVLGESPGGLCVLPRRRFILLDATLPPDRQADVLASALVEAGRSGLAPDLDEVYVLPAVRRFLEDYLPEG